MSGGQICRCAEAGEPIAAVEGSNRPGRLWRVSQRRCNHSAFSGYHYTPSDWSSIRCLRCGNVWRTKASYVDQLLDDKDSDEAHISRGYERHAAAMELRGRKPYEYGENVIALRDRKERGETR